MDVTLAPNIIKRMGVLVVVLEKLKVFRDDSYRNDTFGSCLFFYLYRENGYGDWKK